MSKKTPATPDPASDVDPRERATAVVMTIDWLSRAVVSPHKTPAQRASAALALAMIVEDASRGLRGYFPDPPRASKPERAG